jgi:hypothetical protein
MAIQNRRGDFKDFDPYKMVPGEFAIITSGDPNSKDGTSVYHCFAPGVVKRLTSYEDLKEQVDSSVGEIIDERIEEALKDLEISGGGATEEQIGQIKTNKQNIENLQQTVDNIKIPAKTSELNNDSGFITIAVNDLANYYLKNQTYSRTEIDNKLSTIPKFSIEAVSSLPTSNISTTTVYLVSTGSETNNLYTEYIYVNNKWEYLGKQTVDLTGYVQKTELSSYYTKTEMESLLTTIRNSIPTKISQLSDDSTHRTVTDTEKQTWNNKANTATTLAGYGITDGATKEQFDQLSQEKIDHNQGTANVGKMLIVGADGNLTLADIPENIGGGDVIGMVDENNNIIITGNLADGTYVFKYENTDGTYADIGSLVVGGVVEYSITANLTNCTASSGNAEIIKEGETVTLKYVVNNGFVFTDTVTVSGASYTWDSETGTLVLSNPTDDITVVITATKSGYTNVIDSVGYTDGIRLSTSDGTSERTAEGYVTTGMIDVPAGGVLRTSGVNFTNAVYDNSFIYIYKASDESFIAAHKAPEIADGGYVYELDDDGNLTFTQTSANVKCRLCGYGSGVDLIVTINEEITE